MSSSKRTQHDVIQYLKNNAVNGRLTESLIAMGEELGYSNATMSRVLRSLEQQGLVKVVHSENPRQPNTIVLKKDIRQKEDIVLRGEKLARKLKHLTAQINEYVQEATHIMGSLEKGSKEKRILQEDIVDVIPMPDNEYVLLKVKKDSSEDLFRS